MKDKDSGQGAIEQIVAYAEGKPINMVNPEVLGKK